MIRNLNQLKRVLRPHMLLEVTDHYRPKLVGQQLVIMTVSSYGFSVRLLNNSTIALGYDSKIWFGYAETWAFQDDVCCSYTCRKHEKENLIVSFRVLHWDSGHMA